MKTAFLLEYKYPYGLLNSLWAAKRRYRFFPDKVVLASPDPGSAHTARLVSMISAWQHAYGAPRNVDVLEIEPDTMRATLEQAIRDEQAAGSEVAVDVTSGRTLPKLALYHAALDTRPDHVFYLDVEGYDYRPEAFPLIPQRIQRCHDLDVEDLHGA